MDTAAILKDLDVADDIKQALGAAISLSHEDAIQGLKNKNDELLGEKKDASAQAETAKAQALESEEAKLKSIGDMDELKKFYEVQNAERADKDKAIVQELQQARQDRDRIELHTKFSAKFVDGDTAGIYLDRLIGLDSEGNSTYKDLKGNIIADSQESFSKWLDNAEGLKHVLKGSQAAGGGAGSTTQGSAERTNTHNKTKQQRIDAINAKFK